MACSIVKEKKNLKVAGEFRDKEGHWWQGQQFSQPSVDLASLMIFATFFSLVIDIKESLSLVTQLIHSWSASGIVVVW